MYKTIIVGGIVLQRLLIRIAGGRKVAKRTNLERKGIARKKFYF